MGWGKNKHVAEKWKGGGSRQAQRIDQNIFDQNRMMEQKAGQEKKIVDSSQTYLAGNLANEPYI